VLAAAQRELPAHPLITQAVTELRWLADHLRRTHDEVALGFDLGDLSGYAYYSGARFAIFVSAANDAVVRGGRYDEVGAVFGRNRPAVGFSLDLKALVALAPERPFPSAIRAPWGEAGELRAAIRRLRDEGHTVVCVLPGHEQEAQEYDCDRELAEVGGRWVLRTL